MIGYLLIYLVSTGYIWFIVLIPVLFLRYFAKSQTSKRFLSVAAFICLLLPLFTQQLQEADDRSLKKQVTEHALEFGRFCADGPISPTIHSSAPIERLAVIFVKNPVTEAVRFRTATQIADMLRGQLVCKTRTGLAIQDDDQSGMHELCPAKEESGKVSSSRSDYELVFEKVHERTGQAYGQNFMTKVAVQIRHKGDVLGEDAIYFSSQLPMGTRESCPYPEQRLAELLSGAFQLTEVSLVPEQKK